MSGAVDPVGKRFYVMGSGYLGYYDISGTPPFPARVQITNASGCDSFTAGRYPGLQYDPVQNLLVEWSGGNTVNTYDPATNTCNSQTFVTGPGAQQLNGTHGRFRYVPSLGVFVVCNNWNQNCYSLRLTSPVGDPVTSSFGTIISSVSAGAITTGGATITWTTNTGSTSQVDYGTTTGYGSVTTFDSSLVTSHSQTLSGLTPRTVYHYRVHSIDANSVETITSDFTFTTPGIPDTTPPTISITSPANNSAVGGVLTISADASDNVGVTAVQFLLNGTNLGSALSSPPYSISWDTTASTNGAYVLTAQASDAAGNIGNASPVSVTISNTLSSVLQDFPTRCAEPGVIVCQGFDDASIVTPAVYPASGLYPAGDGVTYGGTIDTSIAASGAGSLKFTIPSFGNPNSAGYWRQLATSTLSAGPSQAQVFGPGSTFYVQFQQRFSPEFLTNLWPQVGGDTTYWKQEIFSNDQSTCSNEELTTVNDRNRGYPMMYSQCGEDVFQVPLNGDYLNEQGDTLATGYNCYYSNPTPGTCFMYPADTWVTFYYKVTIGQWAQPNSTIQAWVALPGQQYQEWINITNHALFQDGALPGYDMVTLLPYMTARDPNTSAGPISYTWYDELILSTQPIAAPALASGLVLAVPPISVSVSPSVSPVQINASQAFVATLQNDSQNQGVTWSLSGSGCSGASCGTLSNVTSSSVTYTAPATAPSPSTVTLTARSVTDTSKTATATITITAAAAISVSVAPSTSSVQVNASQPFTAALQNDSQNQGVIWSLSGSGCSGAPCGTLSNVTSSSVTYTAPAAAPSPSTVTLAATSVTDATKTASAAITITVTASTPALVQHVSCSNSQGNPAATYDCKLPNATLSGNAVIVAFQYADGNGVTNVTVSDDRGDSYAPLVAHTDGNQVANIFGAFNVAPGAQAITLTFNGGSGRFVSAAISEFYNVANTVALDGSSSHTGSGATVTAGSLTPTMSGDLIYQYAINDGPGYSDSWTQGAGPWNLLSADWLNGQVDQYQIQSTAAAINPALTQGVHSGTAGAFNSVAVALRPATAGTPPGSGIRIVHLQHNSFVNINNFSSGTQGAPTIQFPASGNLLVLAGIMVHTTQLYDVSSVADNQGNAWSSLTTLTDTSGDGDEQFAYAPNATTGTAMTVTLTMSANSGEGDSDVLLFDVTGADSAPFDKMTTANGNETAGTSFTGPPLTPSAANGACFSITGVASKTLTAVTPGNFLSSVTSPEGPEAPNDNNNGWSVYFNPDASSFSSTWTNNGGPVNNWGTIVSCFKAPGN